VSGISLVKGVEMDEVDVLVRRVRGGEIEVFAELVRCFEPPVWRVVAALLHNFEESREVMQQVFIDAYLHLDQYQLGRDFGAWIRGIARNRVRQELRRLSRESKHLAVYREHLLERLQDEAAQEREEQAYLDALDACRGQVPEQSARVVRLRYTEEMTFEQIAAELGTTRTAVEKLLSRVRLALRDCIETRLAQA
jgi:RNA polymerase sigma-70 factor (ECF subfamily)